MDRQIRGMLNQQITIEKFKSKSSRGGKEYHDPVVFPCYISGEVKMVRDEEGEEKVSTKTVYLDGTETASNDDLELGVGDISTKDRITLPDGTQPPVISIQPYRDEKGKLNVVEVNV